MTTMLRGWNHIGAQPNIRCELILQRIDCSSLLACCMEIQIT